MSEIVYAVHTRACTYLLDEEGFCRWVLSRSGARSDDRCVGAQFVAALDLASKGGLVGELRIGACALFIRHEDGRFALIRTKPIEHVEIRGAEAEAEAQDPQQIQAQQAYEAAFGSQHRAQQHAAHAEHAAYHAAQAQPAYPEYTEPEPEPVVLPSHHAVAGVFNAPTPAPEPDPPSEQRVIVQSPQPYSAHPYTDPAYAQPAYSEPVYGPPPQVRQRAELPQVRPPTEPPPPRHHHRAEPIADPRTEPLPRGNTQPPPPMITRAPFPVAPPRTPVPPRPRRDEAQATQPLPPSPAVPAPPTGRVPAWPPMLAPPPPQAELLPLAARPALSSTEELDEADLEEVGDDDQVYSMEVTVSMPLFRPDPRAAMPWRK